MDNRVKKLEERAGSVFWAAKSGAPAKSKMSASRLKVQAVEDAEENGKRVFTTLSLCQWVSIILQDWHAKKQPRDHDRGSGCFARNRSADRLSFCFRLGTILDNHDMKIKLKLENRTAASISQCGESWSR